MKELYLDNELVDLYGNENMPINFTNADIDKLSQGDTKGNFSYEIRIPATKTNKLILDFPELDLVESFDASTQKSARLEVNGVTILDGFARIKSVITKGELTHYKLVLYDGNSSWIGSIKDTYLSDLDYSNFDHKYTQNAVLANKINELVSYAPINLGDTVNSNGKWVVEDMQPTFNVRNLIYNIFGVIGYKIQSDFIDSNFFRQLYITSDKLPERRNEDLVIHKFNAGGGDITLSLSGSNTYLETPKAVPFNTFNTFNGINFYNTENNEVGYYLGTNGLYQTSFDGRMSFVWDYDIYSSSNSIIARNPLDYELTFRRYRNGVYTILESRDVTIPKVGRKDSIVNLLGSFTTQSYKVEPGDIYYFTIELLTATTNTQSTGLGNTQSFYNKVYSTVTEGQDIYIVDTMPKIKQIDFLQDIKTAFNLYFSVDEISKSIIIEPRNEFYTNDAEDWSEKVDLSKSIEMQYLGSSLGKNIKFKYADDSNDKYKQFKEKTVNNGNEWLSIEIENTNTSASDATTLRSLKSISSTYIGKGITTAPSAKIPLIWDSETDDLPTNNVKRWKPRLLYYRGKTSLLRNEYWNFKDSFYPFYKEFTINYVSNDGVFVHNNTLDFNSSNYGLGLYDLHYKDTIKTINESQKFYMYIKLNSLDILNLDFRKPKYIEIEGNGEKYVLQRIHDYVSDSVGSVKCEFVKIIESDINAERFISPTNILQPPFIEEEQKEITEPIVEDYNVVCTTKVWASTTENPTGEFVDVENNVIANVVINENTLTSDQSNVIYN